MGKMLSTNRSSPSRSYAARSVIANSSGFVITLVAQLAIVPLYVGRLGVDGYGTWLLISALPAQIALADAGVAWSLGVRMTMLWVENRELAVHTWRSCFWLVLVLGSLALLIIVGSTSIVGPRQLLGTQSFSVIEMLLSMVLLGIYALGCLCGGIILSAYRALGLFPRGLAANNMARGVELMVAAGILISLPRMIALASTFAIVRWLFVVGCLRELSSFHSIGLRVEGVRFRHLQGLVIPSAANMALSLGNAVSSQGALLVVGHSLGPSSVALYSVVRTATNVIRQGIDVFLGGIQPAITEAMMRRETVVWHRIIWRISLVAFSIGVVATIVILLWGPELISFWMHGDIAPNRSLCLWVLLAAIADVPYLVMITPLMAINMHVRVSVGFVLVAISCLILMVPMVGWFGINGAPIAMSLVGLLLLPIAILEFRKLDDYSGTWNR